MRFHVAGHQRKQALAFAQGKVKRLPPAARTGTAAALQRAQKLVAQERIGITREQVPGIGVYFADSRVDVDVHQRSM